MGCGAAACSKKASRRYGSSASAAGEADATRSGSPAVSSTAPPWASDPDEQGVGSPDRKVSQKRIGGPKVCLSFGPSHEALAQNLAEQLTKKLRTSSRLVAAGVGLEDFKVGLEPLTGGTGKAPSCEMLFPLLTPEWLRSPAGAALLRSAQRLRSLSLGPELLPLLHIVSFGTRPDALARAMGTPTGELLREVAAPGSWGRLDSRGSAGGIDAAVAWLASRVETQLSPAPSKATGAQRQRDDLVSWRKPRVGSKSTSPSKGTDNVVHAKPAKPAANVGNACADWTDEGRFGWTPPMKYRSGGIPLTASAGLNPFADVPDCEAQLPAKESSPKRPAGMPSLKSAQVVQSAEFEKFRVKAVDSGTTAEGKTNAEADLEGILAAAIAEPIQQPRSQERRPSKSLKESAAVAAALTPRLSARSTPRDNAQATACADAIAKVGAAPVGTVQNGNSKWASSTAAWADALRHECGEPESSLGVLPGVGGAPTQARAVVTKPLLPPQPRSPRRTLDGHRVTIRGHMRRNGPWRAQETPAMGQGSGDNCSSAPATPRGREEDWDHFNLRKPVQTELAQAAMTAAAGFGAISEVECADGFVQSAPCSPRETAMSWGFNTMQTTMRKTCWGCTATWMGGQAAHAKMNATTTGCGWTVPEEETMLEVDPWEELEEMDDFNDDLEAGVPGNDAEGMEQSIKKRNPAAPQGMPPLPASSLGDTETRPEMASTYASPFGGIWARPADRGAVEGNFGCFVLGDLLPVVSGECGDSNCLSGSKYASIDTNLHRRVVVWHFASPDDVAVTERAKLRDAVAAEVEILRELRHPRLCPYLGCEVIHGELYVIIGYASGGSVADWLQEIDRIDEVPTRRVGCAAVEGLAYLHDRHTPHGGLRSGNVLLGPGAAVRLADFGLSAALRRPRGLDGSGKAGGEPSPECAELAFCAVPWRAPELAKSEAHGPTASEAGDVWAFGCLLATMLAGYSFSSQVASLASDQARTSVLTSHLPPSSVSLVQKCLLDGPSHRPSATELLTDSWITTSSD